MGESDKSTINLPQVLDISKAEAFHAELMEHSGTTSLALEASSVERITTSCIQLILSAARTLEALGGTCDIVNPSAVFTRAFSDLGLGEELESRRHGG